MFGGGKKSSSGNMDFTSETVIGQGTKVKGDIKACGVLRVDGEIEGSQIDCDELIIGQTGLINGEVLVVNATVSGKVKGNLRVKGKIELLSTARIEGDIFAAALIIGEGAQFFGRCDMSKESFTTPSPETVGKTNDLGKKEPLSAFKNEGKQL